MPNDISTLVSSQDSTKASGWMLRNSIRFYGGIADTYNRDLCCGLVRSVGYLADNVPGVCIPLGVLSSLTRGTVPFPWGISEAMGV